MHCHRLFLVTALIAGGLSARAQVNVLTFHNDNARTGQNTNETVLTPANVSPGTFGKLFTYTVDGQVFGEPLYVSGLNIPGQGIHNVVFVATQHNGVYAFDADSNAGSSHGLLWNVSLGSSVAVPNNDFGNRYGPYHDIDPEVGVTSTPVIDLASGTMYLDSFGRSGTTYQHTLHALDITTGAERPGSPVVVAGAVPGIGVGSTAGTLPFNAEQSLQRPALTLAGGKLFVAYSGYADTDPYHGWVFGFDPKTLKLLPGHVFNTTPNSTQASVASLGIPAGEGGIWMSGNGLAADANNDLFFMVGNGPFNANTTGGSEYGDCVMHLATANGLSVADYFAPYNQLSLAQADADLGSAGLMLLPDDVGSSTHPKLLVGCGKEGKIYLLDRQNLGKYRPAGDTQIVQEIPNAVGGCWSSPAYFNGRIYYLGSGDRLKAFQLVNGKIQPTSPVSQATAGFGNSATPAVSANGAADGIVWVIQTDAYAGGATKGGPAVLHAYDAGDLTKELYNSSMSGNRDNPGPTVKFNVPTIANGKVYVGADGTVSVFGLASFVAAPVITPGGGIFTNSVTVSLATATPHGVIYYTTDGSVPTTNSPVYAHPFTLSNTAAVNAFVYLPGSVPSPVASVTFFNSANYRAAPGFLKQEYFAGTTRTQLESQGSSVPADFTHYLAGAETPQGQGVNYAERVSGFVVPPVTGNYVFFVCSDDDSDLFLSTDDTPGNLKLIAQESNWSNARNWLGSEGGSPSASKRSDQFPGTQWPGGNVIHLQQGRYYYFQGIHAQGGGGDNFAATYKLDTDPDPAAGDAPRLAGPVVAAYAQLGAVVSIAAQPQGALAAQGQTASFSVAASAAYPWDNTPLPLFFQWQTAPPGGAVFTNIPGEIAATLTTGPLSIGDNGRRFRAQVSAPGASTNTAEASVAVVYNSAPPLPQAATWVDPAGRSVTLQFSKPLNPTAAQSVANYGINAGGVHPSQAVLDATGELVTLTLAAALKPGATNTVRISGVADRSGNVTPAGAALVFSFQPITYAQNVLLDGPAAYFRFEEPIGATVATNLAGGGDGAYYSGAEASPGAGANPASALGDPGPRPPAFTGFEPGNHSATFDGASLWVDTKRQILQDAAAFTLEYWVSTLNRGNFPARVGIVGQNDAIEYGFIDANDIQIWTPGGGSLTTPYSFADGEWHHIATIGDGTAISTYYDGVLQASAASATTDYGNSGYFVHIGGGGVFDPTGNYFNGNLDEVAIYTHAVQPSRVAAHYTAGKLGSVQVSNVLAAPVGLLRFTSINAAYGQVLIQWVGSGVLQEAGSPAGPWTPSSVQSSPALLPAQGGRFFRLKQ